MSRACRRARRSGLSDEVCVVVVIDHVAGLRVGWDGPHGFWRESVAYTAIVPSNVARRASTQCRRARLRTITPRFGMFAFALARRSGPVNLVERSAGGHAIGSQVLRAGPTRP